MNTTIDKKEEELMDTLRLLGELTDGTLERKFEDIISDMKVEYLKDKKDWLVMYSGGKDSTLVLKLVWKMLSRLSPHEVHKKVHVVSADTKVETRQMTHFLKKNLRLIEENGAKLNIVVHLVEPDMKNSFFWNVLGRGVVPPTPKSPFQWCTQKMKIKSMDDKLKSLIAEQDALFEEFQEFDVTMLLGSRLDESTKRANSIKKHSGDGTFSTHSKYRNIRVYYPVKFIETSDLWAYITGEPQLPWGLNSMELFEMYSDGSSECPMTQAESDAVQEACGTSNSRNGCWVCLYSGRNDKMLQSLINNGHEEVNYLAEWKAFLYDVVYDVRYREPFRRREFTNHQKSLAARQNGLQEDLFTLALDDGEKYYETYQRASKTSYEPGGFTIELRLILLQKLLYTQQMSGYELIDELELSAIVSSWRQEGYEVDVKSDLVPYNHTYDGSVVLNPNGTINTKDTTNPHEVYIVEYEFKYEKDELADYVKERQKLTNKSFYGFFDHQDYHKEKVVYNTAKFVVCHRDITNQDQANNAVFDWLYLEGKKNTKDIMEARSFNAANNMMLLKAVQESIELKRQ